MKALLIYTSKHGTTEKISETICNSSKHEITRNNLKAHKSPDISDYDLIIIGCSIHAGSISMRTKKFIKKNKEKLLTKNTAIFMTCMNHEVAEKQFNDNFDTEIKEKSIATAYVGGEFLFEKMNKLERAIVKKVSGVDHTVSQIKTDTIQSFINQIDKL